MMLSDDLHCQFWAVTEYCPPLRTWIVALVSPVFQMYFSTASVFKLPKGNTVLPGPARNPTSYTSIDYIIDPLRWNPTTKLVAGLRVMLLGKIGNATNDDGAYGWKAADSPFGDLVAGENDIDNNFVDFALGAENLFESGYDQGEVVDGQ